MRYIQIFILACVFTAGIPLSSVKAETPAIYANGVLAYTNAQRYRNNLPLFNSNVLLTKMATSKMYDMFAWQYFEHESPKGEEVNDLANNVHYEYLAVGENLALGNFNNSKDVVEAWMESPGHRANILSDTYSEIGIAAGRSNYEGKNTWIIVQSFGLPRSSCPTLDTALGQEIDRFDSIMEIMIKIVELREKSLDEKGLSRSTYLARMQSYNKAAELYNAKLDVYSEMVEEYNGGVDSYNGCINNKVTAS